MNSDKRVVFPNEMLENRQIETTIFTPANDVYGVAVLSEKAGATIILRLYQLVVDADYTYQPVQELTAFSFGSRSELDSFLDRLPEISGLEMLMLLNPLPGDGPVN
ncbi:hypothetical protein J2Z83_001283 [Virgibacillus natechei]|uniref:Uncharacterized protein n=1 Tax=Virgibacillus natechei TaxID=1216297 RepID=A0ABS4IE14_9BACI|nr:hypothetical protein [Virgibacillus natechei]MBP1969179.1 hypothetical protein [Virgibacillus natechei]UZD12351.1 hypothetical protein OLD84_15755 [Virgibacillus natechei]